MKPLYWFLASLLITSCDKPPAQSTLDRAPIITDQVLEAIAVGSCNRHDLPQPLWPTILNEQPDLWIWLGDNIYGDSEDMSVIASKYDVQLQHPDYRKLITTTPVLGIWDDHDYGANNAGKEYPQKDQTKALMLDFLGIPKTNEVWNRPGAYYSYTFGTDDKRVKCILLDCRYFRDQPVRKDGQYDPENTDGDILGEEQWQWFEAELQDEVAVFVIGNGIQVLPEDHKYEKWANFPKTRNRMIQVLESIDSAKVVLLSGDRHISEISQMTTPNGAVIHELTSSGLTHPYEDLEEEYNRHRIGDFVNEKNFGLLTLDWTTQTPQITIDIMNVHGEAVESISF